MSNVRLRRGSSALEMALCLPVLLLLTFGIMDWSWFLVEWQLVVAAAQQGARTGSQTKLSADPATAAETAASDALAANFTTAVPSATTYTGSIVDGDKVRVTVAVPFVPLVGFMPMPVNLSATAQMRVEDLS